MTGFYGRDFDDDGNQVGDDYGMVLLDDVCEFILRYAVFPSTHAAVAVTLWIAHTWAADQFYVTPRLILDSAEPESGKSRVLELLAQLCRNPKMTFNTTVAALYRRMQDKTLSILLDEADAIWSAKAGPQAEELRALINSGYRRGATVDRCVGEGSKIIAKEFPVFAPVAIAGLAGRVPETVTSRAITIHMRRRTPEETVADYQEEDILDEAKVLRDRLETWTRAVEGELRAARPKMPEGVRDRKAECWRALLAVADAADGAWPDWGRDACAHFVLGEVDAADMSVGVRLLSDIRTTWGGEEIAARFTESVLRDLYALDESPWSDWDGRLLTPRQLAWLLKPYGIRSGQVRVGAVTAKGYRRADLQDAWCRYLGQVSETSETRETLLASAVSHVSDVSLGRPLGACSRHAATRFGRREHCRECQEAGDGA